MLKPEIDDVCAGVCNRRGRVRLVTKLADITCKACLRLIAER